MIIEIYFPNEIFFFKQNKSKDLMSMFLILQFKEGDIRPVHDDILIAKLRPGQVGGEYFLKAESQESSAIKTTRN